jgi:trimeric autotransporter adhesin
MQYLRSEVVGFILILTIIIFLVGCGGGHSNTIGPITTITLTPNPTVSLNAGDVIQMTANATDAKGNAVTNQTFTFNSSNSSIVQMSSTSTNIALLCAGGEWEDNQHNASLTNPIICAPHPATPPAQPAFNFGQANITVTAQGATSNSVAVSVHPKVARVVVTQTFPSGNCVSQGAGFTYQAQAFDGATPPNNISNQVGNFTWTIADTTIGTITTTTPPDSSGLGSTNSAFAVMPGLTTVTASVNTTNPVNSAAVPFQECAVANITLTSTNPAIPPPLLVFDPSPGAVGATGQLTATAMDSNPAGSQAVSGIVFAWNTTQPAVATVSSGLVTAVAPGTSTITASCALNTTCNKNQNALVTSNTAIASVSGSSATTVYATSSQGGNTSLVPIDTTTNTAGTAISLPFTPNSLVFDGAGANTYLGSDSGLMIVNATNTSFTKTVSGAPGQVLAVSPNGQFVLVGGKLSNGSFVSTVLYNTTTSTVTGLNITNAVAASFSPDSSEAVVADTTGVRVAQGTLVRTVSATVATDVNFLATGALSYLAAANAPSVIACNSTLNPGQAASGAPTRVKTLPDGSKMLGAELPSLAVIGVTTSGNTCPPTIAETPAVLSFGAGTKAGQTIVTPDGRHAYITSDASGKLLSYDVAGNSTGSVTLAGTAPVTFSPVAVTNNILNNGGATLDSASVYVGVQDGTNGSVHQINVSAGTDAAQIPVSFIPDLVAVRPH